MRGSRPASVARPARPARTPAGSSASTSSTRSRCSRSSSRRRRGPSTSGCSRSRSGSSHALEIPYRVVNIPVGDLGASAARKFDCEAWIPGQGRYRELTSMLEHDRLPGAATGLPLPAGRGRTARAPVQTLNGTAVAVGRTLIAIMENRQQADGSVSIPPVLVENGAPTRVRRASIRACRSREADPCVDRARRSRKRSAPRASHASRPMTPSCAARSTQRKKRRCAVPTPPLQFPLLVRRPGVPRIRARGHRS